MTTTAAEPLSVPADLRDRAISPEITPGLVVPRRPHLDLFLVSFLILFFELACIRWFGSTVVFLTFFTNIVLLASFLGMSVGLMTATRRQNFMRWVLPLTLFTVALALATFWAYQRFADQVMIDVGGQESPQLIYFGTEYRAKDLTKFDVPLEVVAGTFFVLISVMFVGLGQTMGRAFDAIPNRVLAYTTDVFGSLTGIAAFFAMSWFQLSPHVWFVVVMVVLLYFVRDRWTPWQVFGAMGTMFLIATSAYGVGAVGGQGNVFWSPYYKVAYTPQTGDINTNNIAHQQMLDIQEAGPAYALPHLLNRDAGGKPFGDVMIIGAGSGNDVSAALHYGTPETRIDAVEIDPMIQQVGIWDHPDQPYADSRVTRRNDDGRSFVRKTDKQYDMISYALVDSLVLQSGYSSLRLESFLFTEEAFHDVNAKLKPGGVFAMYNFYRQGWVVGRLAKMAEQVFGVKPLVISLPYQERISPADNQANHITFLLVGKPDASGKVPTIEAIRGQFDRHKWFWLHEEPRVHERENGAGPVEDPADILPDFGLPLRPPTPTAARGGFGINEPPMINNRAWLKIGPATVETERIDRLPTDNWPFLYLKDNTIPWAPSVRGIILIAALSLAVLLSFSTPVWVRRRVWPNGQMFFLGAGFMLLETKGVVHMALLFGSTWVVNSVVFFAILVMILFSNLFVMAFKPRKLWPYYALLTVALLVNALVPLNVFLSLEPTVRTVTSCLVVFVPIFFAGVIFATSFRDSRDPATDFGSNVAGIILGGLSEYLSLIVGFNYLIFVAIGYYLLSMVLRPRLRGLHPDIAPPAPSAAVA